MPYIKKIDKEKYRDVIEDLRLTPKTPAGEINYLITVILLKSLGSGYNYQRINDLIGALECCKLEFTRRITAPYEENKIKENGDVYDYNVSSM